MFSNLILAALIPLAFSSTLYAQFPVVGTATKLLYPLHNLSDGSKLAEQFRYAAQTLTIYNVDLSVYRVLDMPAPPAGKNWVGVTMIADALFDQDPSTIEFAIAATDDDGVVVPGTSFSAIHVYREDGTQLFVADPGFYGGTLMVGGQAYLLINDGTSTVVGPTTVYALPGSLVCLDCYGSPSGSNIGLGGVSGMEPFARMSIQPNPAQSVAMVSFEEDSVVPEEIVLIDTMGREIVRQPTGNKRQVHLNIGALPGGEYILIALRSGQRTGSLPLVIAR